MYAFLPLAILGLAATGAVAQTPTSSSMPTSSSTTAAAQSTPSSFSAWVQELPSCAQACVKNSFHDVYASICGQNAYDSSNPNDLRCICKVRNGNGQMTHEAEREISCLTNNCMSLYSGQQHKKVLHDLRGYVDMCAPYNSMFFFGLHSRITSPTAISRV